MQAPRFWARPPAAPGPTARALAPLAALYAAVTRRRMERPGVRPGVPVVCVGNLTLGGAGKTPTVEYLLGHFADRGTRAHVLSRGHGGSLGRQGPVRVDPSRHRAADVGDEPLLLAALAPVWVGRDRTASARAAVAAGAEVLVMDDGFQNPGLVKDLSILVIDAGFGLGNGRVFPAGPLREPLAAGQARADLLLLLGTRAERQRLRDAWPQLAGTPAAEGELRPLQTGMDWAGMRVLAFAGIGRPEKFFATLRGLGVDLAATRSFADHAPFDDRILARLAAEARAAGAQLVTTEKDAIRLPAAFRPEVLVLPVRLALVEPGPLATALQGLEPRKPGAADGGV